MKCLQCGTELDRLSKWRGSSDYCSEECKKESQEEFNRLAMSRLMQPRPVRTSARAAASSVRTVESATGRLTMVTHPVGASSPIVTEPPEAEFIIDISASLAELQIRHQSYVLPRPAAPSIPNPELPMGDALLALEAILRGIRPPQRPVRELPRLSASVIAHPPSEDLELTMPACEPVWPGSLGLTFLVAGLDNLPSMASVTTTAPSASPRDPAPALPQGELQAPKPVAHRAIPSRRPARALAPVEAAQTGSEYFLVPPLPSAPRLRIHLPKPVLNPFRPRYGFAPRDVAAPAAAPAEPVEQPVPAAKSVPPAGEEPDRKVNSPAPEPRQETRPAGKPALAGRKAEPAASPVETPAAPKPEAKSRTKTEAKQVAKSPDRTEGKADAPSVPARKAESPKPETGKTESAKPALEPSKPETVRESYSAPSFGGKGEEEPEGFFSRMPGWQKAAAALVIIGIAVGVWAVPAMKRAPSRPAALPASASTAMGADSWETDSTGDTAGIARRRVISHYKPARTKRDYVFEFTGQIEQRAIGWVFRMKDARNYYCLKLERTGEGPSSPVQLVKFAVINGEEQPHRLVSLRQPVLAGAPIRVRLDVRGQNFATQVDGQPVDVWIDNQIGEGTVGFSNESGERAVIRTVKVSY